MARVYTKTDCPLYGSQYCEILNMESCDGCTVKPGSETDAARVRRDLNAYAAKLPKEGISELFAGDECLLCKGESKGKKEWYALTDLANAGEGERAANLFGIPKAAKRGLLLPVQIACCSECRRRIRRLDYVPSVIALAFIAAGFIAMSIRPLREALMGSVHALPFILFAVLALIGLALGAIVKRSMLARYGKVTRLDIFTVPLMEKLGELGWFELNRGRERSKLVFSAEPIKQGIYTRMPEGEAPEREKTENIAPDSKYI